jgi:hypothetical protein
VRRASKALLILALFAGLLPISGIAKSSSRVCKDLTPPKLSFQKPVYVDTGRAGGEPVIIAAEDGSLILSSHAGTTHLYKDPTAAPGSGDFARSYYNQTLNWRSTDGGKTWQYIGLFGAPEGPHTATSTGFSDPDLTMDAGGRIYNTEINLANVAVFSSSDDGQSWPRGNPIAASGDRPWLTGAEAEEVFLYVNLPKQLWRSTNGGLTFDLVTTSLPADSKILVDPLNPKKGLIGPMGSGIAISADDGKTWTEHPGRLGKSTQFFGAIAVDRAGWAYAAAAGGYNGSNDEKSDGEVSINYFNRKTKKWLPEPIIIPNGGRDAMWPWLTAGDDGRLAVAWYEREPETDKFFIKVAYTLNAHGTTVTCSDGSKQFIPPQFSVANASQRPIHNAKICLSGTTCNANPSFEGGDRRLGDFFTISFDREGNLIIASADTMLKSPTGGEKSISNPLFIKQSGGARMLVKPDPTRKTRPLCITPNC